jgi:hypothetical protein
VGGAWEVGEPALQGGGGVMGMGRDGAGRGGGGAGLRVVSWGPDLDPLVIT